MTPLVTIPPTCSFTYPNGSTTLQLNGTTSQPATLNITTFGPITTGAHLKKTRGGLWLAMPLLGMIALGTAAGGKRLRGAWTVMALLMLSAAFVLTPGCGTTNPNSTTTPNGVTPSNTYTFTINGVDSNGVVSSNTTSTTSTGPTVSLTVTAPPKTP
jgi:hypothetical protein